MAKKRPAPFSLRLTFEQRARLEELAGDMSLSAYIIERVFAGEGPKFRGKGTLPGRDQKTISELMGRLGQSRLSANLNQLAKAANTGSLPVTPDTEAALQGAVSDVRDMRRMLMEALNLREGP